MARLGDFRADEAYKEFAAITPSDSVDLTLGGVATPTDAVWVGGAGNVVVVDSRGATTTFTGVTAGALLKIRARRINATLTTATAMVALWFG